MPPKTKYQRGGTSASRQFTNRESFIAAFNRWLEKQAPDQHRVLVYYGVGGIGKTALRKHLAARLEKKGGVCWATVNFENPDNRKAEQALFLARHALRSNAHFRPFRFPSFDVAYAVYWEKAHPQTALSKKELPFLEEGDLLADLINTVEEVPGLGLLPKIAKSAHKLTNTARDWWLKRGHEELRQLAGLEADEILDRLPMFWASDVADQLAVTDERLVVFLDTYEALWDGKRLEHQRFAVDEWVREWVAQLPGVLWVITGREKLYWHEADAGWSDVLDQHLIGALAEEDARHFLQTAGVTEQAVQDAMMEGAEGVPFYLDLALDHYENIRSDRAPVPDDFGRTPRDVIDRFLRYLGRAERETINVLIAARVWDRALFEDLITHFKTGYPPAALRDLCRFSFVEPLTTEGDEPTWTLHALMRRGVQEHAEEERVHAVHQFLFERYNERLATVDHKAITDRQRRALEEAFYHGQQVLEREAFIAWYRETDDVFQQAAQWRLLIPMQEAVVDFVVAAYGEAHEEAAEAWHNLANLYYEQAHYEKAEPLYQRSLDIKEEAFGEDHQSVAATLNNLAELYHHQGRYAEAESLFLRSLGIRKAQLGEGHPDVGQSLNNLASVYESQGRYAEAEPLFLRTLRIIEQALGIDHPHVATTLNNLAELYRQQGRYAEAEPLYQRSLKIRKAQLGEDHPDVGQSLTNLAGLYESQGRYTEAEPLYLRDLEISERALGKDHPHVATTLTSLASLYRQQGRYAEAESLFQRSLGIKEEAFGQAHPSVATTLNNLAGLYRQQGRYAEAESLFQRSLGIKVETFGKDHPSVATTLNNLAELYRQQGRYAEAESFYQRSLGTVEQALGADHPHVAMTLNNLAELYRQQGRYTEAEPLYVRSWGIMEQRLGTEHPYTRVVRANYEQFVQERNAAEREADDEMS